MDYIKVRANLVEKIRSFMNGRNAIIGESGGVDSALITFLCVEALGKDKIFARTMPYGDQSTGDADKVASILELPNYGCTNIKLIVDGFGFTNRLTMGNTRARVRMAILYGLASENNGLVIGTSNRTEMMLGYFTKYGDGGCDVEPIGGLFKTEVWEVAKTYPNFPPSILNKPPSAELWAGQTDESEIGMPYSEMDNILKLLTGRVQGQLHDLKLNLGEDKVSNIMRRIKNSEHKRKMPETLTFD